jgi:DNA-binding LacI/PurR family transcriptional regulator
MRVAGHDDHPWSRYTCPPLTTVSQDYKAIAEHSFKMLLEIINGETHANERPEILFEGTLVLRSSA